MNRLASAVFIGDAHSERSSIARLIIREVQRRLCAVTSAAKPEATRCFFSGFAGPGQRGQFEHELHEAQLSAEKIKEALETWDSYKHPVAVIHCAELPEQIRLN